MSNISLKNAKYEYLNINNIKIHTVSMGTDDNKSPILLLHGFPEFHYSYRFIMPILAKKRKVIAIDQRGYNLSSKPKKIMDYSVKYLMSDVVEVIKQKSPTKKVILVGHDWGGAISWHVARFYPKFIEKLIILNCPPADLLFKAILRIPKQFLMSYYIFLFQLPKLPELLFKIKNSELIRQLCNRIKPQGKKMTSREIEKYIQCFQRPRGASGINYYRAAFRDTIKGNLKTHLKVRCPTLVLWGTKDFALHIDLTKHFPEYVEENLFKIKYFSNSGHFIQQEIPNQVSEEILNFI